MRLPTITVRREVMQAWLQVSAYTKTRLAEELGVSRGRASQLCGATTEPSAHVMAKLIEVTNLPFDRLFKLVKAKSKRARSRRNGAKVRRN
jgi:transcriptional regulator with XRE-family HTH domain